MRCDGARFILKDLTMYEFMGGEAGLQHEFNYIRDREKRADAINEMRTVWKDHPLQPTAFTCPDCGGTGFTP